MIFKFISGFLVGCLSVLLSYVFVLFTIEILRIVVAIVSANLWVIAVSMLAGGMLCGLATALEA